MEDMERYADYNEVDEAPDGGKNPVVTLLKLLVLVLCFAVVGVLAFRVVLFNYYPSEISDLYFNKTLTDYYNSTDGDIGAKTQELRAPYDDPDFASFFCDNLIIIEGAEQLQVSVRYNSSVFDSIKEEYGVELDPSSDGLFTFKLFRVPFEEGAEPYEIGRLDTVLTDEVMMYTYYKLVFDDVEFLDGGAKDWLRLEITLNGVEGADPYYILIYEVSDEYDSFRDYKPGRREKP